ncbi:MAG: NYN domain-containing protein, partial [Chloroflexi bacterium]
QAIHLARKRGYVTTLGSLKMLMKELMGGDFKESRYRDLNGRPFTKFKDLVIDAEQRGKVQIFTKGSVNEVFLPGEDPMKLSRFAPLLTEEPPPEPVVLDPPIGSNGGIQLAEIEPVIIEEVKTTVAETPAATPSSSNRRRRRRSRRSNRNRDEVTVNGLVTESAITDEQDDSAIDDLDYTPPQLEEPAVVVVETTSSDHGFVSEMVVPSEHLPSPLADVTEPVTVVVESKPTPKTGRSHRRRSRKATAESTPIGESSPTETTVAEPSVTEPVVAATPPAEPVVVTTPPAEPVVAATPPAELTPPTTTDGSSDHVDLTLEFSAEEWQLFRTTIRELGKPATFQQLLSALQTARRKHSLTRTMEENRTMLKQAIHHGMLERTTRNRYVYYTLKELE